MSLIDLKSDESVKARRLGAFAFNCAGSECGVRVLYLTCVLYACPARYIYVYAMCTGVNGELSLMLQNELHSLQLGICYYG